MKYKYKGTLEQLVNKYGFEKSTLTYSYFYRTSYIYYQRLFKDTKTYTTFVGLVLKSSDQFGRHHDIRANRFEIVKLNKKRNYRGYMNSIDNILFDEESIRDLIDDGLVEVVEK